MQVGAGEQVVQAYVEIVFDNSDNRLTVRARVPSPSLPCLSGSSAPS